MAVDTLPRQYTKERVYQGVIGILEEVLEVNKEDINPECKLNADLGFEGGDYLDLSHRLRVDLRINVGKEDFIPRMEAGHFTNGKINPVGRTYLQRFPHVRVEGKDEKIEIEDITVAELTVFVQRKLGIEQ